MIIALIAMGVVMTELPLNKLKQDLYAWHKWIGITVLLLALVRLFWRFFWPRVAVPAKQQASNVPEAAEIAAKLGHVALYSLLIAVPLIGWLRSSTAGFEVVWFQIIPLPELLGKNEALSNTLEQAHEIAAYTLLVLLAGHIGAVVVHHKFWHDPILEKMSPGLLHKVFVGAGLLAATAFMINYLIINPPPKSATQKITGEKITIENAHKKQADKKAKPDTPLWQVGEKSRLTFTATQKGAKTTGNFETLKLTSLRFDPNAPEKAVVEVEIEIASMKLGNAMIEQTLLAPGWFDAGNHPLARFRAEGFEAMAEGTYRLNGALTIKDITKPLKIIMNIEQTTDKQGRVRIKASGTTIINRLSYQIGEYEWETDELLDADIGLTIEVDAIKAR